MARSRRTAPCIWPEKPIALKSPTALPAASLISVIAPAIAASQSSGFCSDQPARGRLGEYDRAALATGWPLSSIRSALSPEVPQSSPRYMGLDCAPGGKRAQARAQDQRKAVRLFL